MPIETKNAGLVVQISVYAGAGVPYLIFGGVGVRPGLTRLVSPYPVPRFIFHQKGLTS